MTVLGYLRGQASINLLRMMEHFQRLSLLCKHYGKHLLFWLTRKSNLLFKRSTDRSSARAFRSTSSRVNVTFSDTSMRVTCHVLPVRSQRASSGSGASQQAEQNSSTYHSGDNETDVRVNTHTYIYAHVYNKCII